MNISSRKVPNLVISTIILIKSISKDFYALAHAVDELLTQDVTLSLGVLWLLACKFMYQRVF